MTPVGNFNIIRKIVDPGWEHPYKAKGAIRIAPGENNPLGTRWMGFLQKGGGEYGMHGTDTPSSVGKFSSHGCVRLHTKDAEKLFDMVDVGTPVRVEYEPVLIRRAGDNIRIIVYRDLFKRGMPTADTVKTRILQDYPNAQVDMDAIQTTLKQTSGQPVVVGSASIDNPQPVAKDGSPTTLTPIETTRSSSLP
jgi:hypothetical protein